MIEHNLFAQAGLALVSASVFLVIIEGFGFAITKAVAFLLNRFYGTKTSNSGIGLVPRIYIGLLGYTLIFLFIGWVGLITKLSVLSVSCLVPLLLFFIGRRWHKLTVSHLRLNYHQNKYLFWGGLVFLLLTLVLWFRPITNFDPLWYHLTVPKLFLQNHTVAYQGSLISYSLQPSLDYFANLWPLSMPASTPVASIVVNTFQVFMLTLGLLFSTQIGKKVWNWGKFHQFAAPILIGGTYETLRMLGVGGNDLLGVAFGLVATLYCFYLLTKDRIGWHEFVYGLLLIVGLASIKIFFTLFALLVLAYFVVGAWKKLPEPDTTKRLVRLIIILLMIFVVAYLPWLIRSYVATGRILDPLGSPGLNHEVYLSEGGGTAQNHWTNFIFTRFYDSIWPILTFVYSPLVLVGLLSIFSDKVRKQASNLWLVAVVGLWAVFFASIALQWRYYLPPASILVFLGFVTLVYAAKDFDVFGKIVIWGVAFLLVGTAIFRVILASPDATGFPSINRDIYVSHFTNINDYLDHKLSSSTFDYVQEVAPTDLRPDEKIYIGNTYIEKSIPIYGMMKLAYVKNPILDHTINYNQFNNIKTADNFMSVLNHNHVRYVLTRDSMLDVCKIVGVTNYKQCENKAFFKPVLHDARWNVEWYLLLN